MKAYYNDNDRHAGAWLRELIAAGMITDGDVDERSIAEVKSSELKGYGRVHFFAGIGGWDYALRLAGWPSDRYVWTGSCPCQPLSGAGKRKGELDERHLWPHFHRLIEECHPPVVFGEQVASNDGREWFAGVRADLEALEYAVGGADLCAAGEGAPHIRQRLYWVADAGRAGQDGPCRGISQDSNAPRGDDTGNGGEDNGMADSMSAGWPERWPESGCGQAPRKRGSSRLAHPGHGTRSTKQGDELQERDSGIGEPGASGGLSDSECQRLEEYRQERTLTASPIMSVVPSWDDAILIPCGDGKARRIEPGISPLVNGLPGRVGLLRGYGNAIVPQVAAKFIMAYQEYTLRG